MFTFAEAAAFYREAIPRVEVELSELVRTVVTRAEVLARGYIGHHQDGWEPLSTATIFGFRHPTAGWIVGKEDRGFSGPDYEPLLGDSHEMHDSISSEAEGLVGIVGSDSKIALYQEMGTPNARYPTPPRPFLARGLMEAEAMIEPMAREIAQTILIPG